MAFADGCWFIAGSSGTADFADGTALPGFRNLAGAATDGLPYSYRAQHPSDPTIWEIGRGNKGSGALARTTIVASSTGSKIDFTVAPVVVLTPNTLDLADVAKFSATAPVAAGFSSPNITMDALDGARLFFTRTMAGAETLAVPSNLPDGGTLYVYIVAGANTLSFASGYVGPGDDLPDVTGNALLSIVRRDTSYIVSALSNLGDGS